MPLGPATRPLATIFNPLKAALNALSPAAGYPQLPPRVGQGLLGPLGLWDGCGKRASPLTRTAHSCPASPPSHRQVNQGNMPGVQSTFLAMDTEEGVEVVWNELHFSDRKAFSAHEVRPATSLPPHLLCPPRDHPPFPGEDPDHV